MGFIENKTITKVVEAYADNFALLNVDERAVLCAYLEEKTKPVIVMCKDASHE